LICALGIDVQDINAFNSKFCTYVCETPNTHHDAPLHRIERCIEADAVKIQQIELAERVVDAVPTHVEVALAGGSTNRALENGEVLQQRTSVPKPRREFWCRLDRDEADRRMQPSERERIGPVVRTDVENGIHRAGAARDLDQSLNRRHLGMVPCFWPGRDSKRFPWVPI
jgi:hypothetical protein